MRIKHPFQVILSILVLYSLSIGQSKTNFELVDSLIQLSVNNMSENINDEKNYNLFFRSAEDYSLLETKVVGYLQQNGVELLENKDNSAKLNYNLDEARITYSDVFKDGLFGNYLVVRKAEITGSYFVNTGSTISDMKEFNYVIEDSVLYSNISRLENIAYSFTNAEIPEEPFFSSTLEPVIAIGTAAVAAYLFFNIRSK